MSFFYYFRRKTPLLRAFLVFCLASAFASDRGVAATIGADGQISASNAATDAGTKKSKFCSGYGRGMTLVDWTKEYGEVCRPTGDTLSARVNACLARGLEAVMVPDFDGVVCAGVARGTEFLKAAAKREGAARYAPIEDAKIEQLCQIGATTADRRLIPRTFIKDLVRKSKDDIDPHGVRIIGGAFCDGIDVAGLEMPYSLVLDKSVFACSGSTECRRAAIEIRNFKTKGDFSIDNTFSYISVRVVRSEISGSLYGHSARFPRLLVSDSIIHGSLKAPGANISEQVALENSKVDGDVEFAGSFSNAESKEKPALKSGAVGYRLDITGSDVSGSIGVEQAQLSTLAISGTSVRGSVNSKDAFVADKLALESVKVDGDIDLAGSFFSHLVLLKNHIGGSLDLGQTQARCSFDIRKNEIDDVVAVEFGFGGVGAANPAEAKYDKIYGFKNFPAIAGAPPAALRPAGPAVHISKDGAPAFGDCTAVRSIDPGSFVFIGNHIQYSMCIRDFYWLSDSSGPRDSIIYINEDVVDGATWLDIQPVDSVLSQDAHAPMLSIFNLKTGTFVLDFDVAAADKQNIVVVKVNGLHFERVYTAKDKCEMALAPRATGETRRRDAHDKPSFPPDLNLPNTNQVADWVRKNSFKGTQPFSEFVAVFEHAGDMNGAKDLKIKSETSALKARLCRSWGLYCADPSAEPDWDADRREAGMHSLSATERLVHRIEDRLVSILQLGLWGLADHGYRPERVVWYIAGSLIVFWFAIQVIVGVIGYSIVEGGETDKAPQVRPVSLLFLFDKLVPAYKIREEHSKPLQFYVLASDAEEPALPLRRFRQDWRVVKADDARRRRVEIWLDVLRFIGIIFALFLATAIGRIVR